MIIQDIKIPYDRSLYILGTAADGPTNTPILIKDKVQALSLFGNSELVDAWHEAYQVSGDNVNIYLVRINGINATLKVQCMSEDYTAYNGLTLTAYTSGDIWNNASITITEEYFKFSNPSDIGGDVTISFSEHLTIGYLVNAINYAFGKGAIGVTASCSDFSRPTSDIVRAYKYMLDTPIYMMGGDDDLFFNKNELHRKLDMTYNILEGQTVDVICVVGAYFDDISPIAYYNSTEYGELFYTENRDYLTLQHQKASNKPATFHGQLIEFCKKQMASSIMTHGVIAFNPIENLEDIMHSNAYITKVSSATCFYDRHDIISKSSETVTEDNGKYISVVLGEFEYEGVYGNLYYNNAYIGYASMIASSLTSQSLTNKVVPNITRMRHYLDDEEALLLAQIGVTTFRKSILKQGIVVSNGVTAALSSSPYHVVSNMRMIQMILTAYNSNLEKYIGENVDLLNKSKAMHKEVDDIAKILIEAKVAKDIKPTCTISPYGVAVIHLEIMPIYSTEYVGVTNTLKI